MPLQHHARGLQILRAQVHHARVVRIPRTHVPDPHRVVQETIVLPSPLSGQPYTWLSCPVITTHAACGSFAPTFQTRTVMSIEQETIVLPSPLNTQPVTPPSCPFSTTQEASRSSAPRSQARTVLS